MPLLQALLALAAYTIETIAVAFGFVAALDATGVLPKAKDGEIPSDKDMEDLIDRLTTDSKETYAKDPGGVHDGGFHGTPPGNQSAASGIDSRGTVGPGGIRDGGFHNGGGGGGGDGAGRGTVGGGTSSGGSTLGNDNTTGHKGDNGRLGHAPIVLDLDRDKNIELALKSDGAFFDMDNDGVRDATGWVGKDDGLLVIDLAANGTAGADGVINQSSEVVFTNWVAGSTSDMAAVKAVFDPNKNGLLDEGDARYGEFRVWQDKNGDGISQQGELKTLAELKIKTIDLNPTGEAKKMDDGSVVTGTSTVTMTDGRTMLAGDSTFAVTSTSGGGKNTLVGTAGDDLIYGGNGWRLAA